MKAWHMKKMTIEPKMPCQSLQNCEGTLLGLHDAQRKFLGLGVLKSADCSRMNLRVWTAVAREPAVVVLGKVRLDGKLHEVSSFNFTGAF